MTQDQAGKAIAIDTELARWKKVALKALRTGQPQREFASNVIPEEIKATIAGGLSVATTEDDVSRIFAHAKPVNESAAMLEAAARVLANG